MASGWRTQDQRQEKQAGRIKKLVLVLLAAAAIVLVIERYYPAVFSNYHLADFISDKSFSGGHDELELFYSGLLSELGLTRTEINSGLLDFNGDVREYPCYSVSWPGQLPYVWFVLKLQNRCYNYSNLFYDAVEINKGKKLVSWLVNSISGDTTAEFVLVASSNQLNMVSSISFLFKNFADYKLKEALDLIWLDIPFGFILLPDQIPNKKLSKALKSSKGQCILEIPADRESWKVILNCQRFLKNIRNPDLDEDNILAIFKIFPALNGFYFNRPNENDIDRELVRMVVDAAEKLKLNYIYDPEKISYCDSLVYSKGLKIKMLTESMDCCKMTYQQLKDEINSRTNQLTKSNKGLLIVNSNKNNMDVIASFLPLFEKLNITLVPPLRHAETVDRL